MLWPCCLRWVRWLRIVRSFFPQTKRYAARKKKAMMQKGNLQSVMTYTVDEVKNIPSGLEVEADYVFKNSAGTVYDKGDLEAFCEMVSSLSR